MNRVIISFTVIVVAFMLGSCSKNADNDESVLYGTWVKGTNFGDTLQFMRKNNQNIVRQSMSFNSGLPVYTEQEYKFRDGILNIKLYGTQEYSPITSFTWTQTGNEFTVQGIQLFMFMSSTQTYFTYRKI